MNILVLGKGKTGALVPDVARERGHLAATISRVANQHGEAVAPAALAPFDVIIDFTTPESAVRHIEACARSGKNIVVGTTGWYEQMPRVRQIIADCKTSLVWGGNFSIGVNLFYSIVRASAAAAPYGYEFSITETHHIHKKDAPSGTAVVLQNILKSEGIAANIQSIRKGENMGRHEITLASKVDAITLLHQAQSRRGFALGAVRAAEWISTAPIPGVYDFSDIFQQLG